MLISYWLIGNVKGNYICANIIQCFWCLRTRKNGNHCKKGLRLFHEIHRLTFWYNMHGKTVGSLSVYLKTNDVLGTPLFTDNNGKWISICQSVLQCSDLICVTAIREWSTELLWKNHWDTLVFKYLRMCCQYNVQSNVWTE